MKTRTKIIILISFILVIFIITINNLFEKKVQYVPEEQIETQITSETTTSSTNTTTTTKTTKTTLKTTNKTTSKTTTKNTNKSSGGFKLTHYGYDCKGCGGKTATGYDISKTIYYNDKTYGNLRVVAMCSNYPLYSVIKIKNYKLGGDTLAIVLDRGVGCGVIDLAVKNEKQASQYGIQNNIQIEILRKGK